MKIFLRVLTALLYFSTMGCIHTAKNEHQKLEVQEPSPNDFSAQLFGNLQMQTLIYDEGKLPLDDFFVRLKRGDYKKLFKKIHFDYKASNVNNKILQDLIDEGFIPVYVKIQNNGDKPIKIKEKDFALINTESNAKTLAFDSANLPKEFEHFSPKALAANIYNTGVVITGTVAVFAVMALAQGFQGYGGPFPGFGSAGEDNELYNSLQKTTTVNYQQYLISERTLKPGESVQGLLIFFGGEDFEAAKAKVLFSPNKET